MTISTTYQPVYFDGNGVTTAIPFPYKFFDATDLVVELVLISTGAKTTQVLDVDYSVTGGGGSTGSVVFVTPPSALYRGVITYVPQLIQDADLVDGDPLFAEEIETALDKTTLSDQYLHSLYNRALYFPSEDFDTNIGPLPAASLRRNNLMSFDDDGKPSAVTLASISTNIDTTLTTEMDGDFLVYDTGTWKNRRYLFSQGTDIASANTTDIGAANSDYVRITGTTTITSLGSTTVRHHIWVTFTGALILTHNATSLILPGAANITTVAGDVAEFVRVSGSNWRCLNYTRADGTLVGVIDNTILADMPGNTVKVRAASTSGDPSDLSIGSNQVVGRGPTGDVSAITVVTPWVAYTPTFTGFGTASSVAFFSRRIGDSLQVRGQFTVGTPTPTEARITLGYDGVDGGVTTSSTKLASGVNLVGDAVRSNVGTERQTVLAEQSVGYMTFGMQNAGNAGLTKANGNTLVGAGNVYSVFGEFPINGW